MKKKFGYNLAIWYYLRTITLADTISRIFLEVYSAFYLKKYFRHKFSYY